MLAAPDRTRYHHPSVHGQLDDERRAASQAVCPTASAGVRRWSTQSRFTGFDGWIGRGCAPLLLPSLLPRLGRVPDHLPAALVIPDEVPTCPVTRDAQEWSTATALPASDDELRAPCAGARLF